MADNDARIAVNIATAFMDPLKRPATAALLNSYFARRQIAGLLARLTSEDIENLTNLLHWHTPPDNTGKMLESMAAGTPPQMPDVATATLPPAEPGHPDDPDRLIEALRGLSNNDP